MGFTDAVWERWAAAVQGVERSGRMVAGLTGEEEAKWKAYTDRMESELQAAWDEYRGRRHHCNADRR